MTQGASQLLLRLAKRSAALNWARLSYPALSIGGLIVLWSVFQNGGPGFDFYAYWAVDPHHPYDRMFEAFNAFRYSPPVIWLAGPLKLLPFETAYWIWFAMLFGVLIALTHRWALAWLLFPPVSSELYHGNVHLLLAAALVWGFRWPALWAFLPLSKVTTCLVGLWALIRRDRRLVPAVATVLAAILISVVATPAAWPEWIARLTELRGLQLGNGGQALIDIPLVPRLVVAVAITVWAARSDRRWPLAVALVLSLPQLWIHGLSILAAVPLLRRNSPPARSKQSFDA